MSSKLLLLGGGGHCRSCLDVIRNSTHFTIIGILDKQEKVGQEVDGIKIIGTDLELNHWLSKTDYVLITIGKIGKCNKRKILYNKLKKQAKFPIIISPRAYVSKYSKIGEGTIIMHDALVNSGAIIGENCIINSKSLVEHDSVIGDHSHISTGVIVNGGVTVGKNCFVGTRSVIFEYRHIDSDKVIPGGQIVKHNIEN